MSTAHTRGSRLAAVALTCGSNRSIAGFSLTCQSACGPSPTYGGAGSRMRATLAAPLSSLAACRVRTARSGLRSREPEGRRRQDDDRRQPQRVPRRGGRARAPHRSRSAGERDVRARDAGERRVDARPPRRRAAARRSRSRPRSTNLDVVMAKSDLAAAAVELSSRDGGERYLADALAGTLDAVLVRPPRLPAVVRAADGQRARGCEPRDRPGAGRVLRARGALAAARHDQSRQGAAQSRSSRLRGSC